MINAWSLAWEALNGTMDKEYPIKNESYDDFENPNPPQNIDLNVGAGNTAHDTDWIANSGGYEWTPGSPWPPSVPDNDDETIDEVEKAYNDYYGIDDGLDYEVDYIADVDDQRAHHFSNAHSFYNDGWTQKFHQEQLDRMDYEPQRNHQYKYHEEEILKDIEEYVSRTYQGHYTGTKHEFRKVQTIDLMAARDIAPQFCQANILKYGSRYGSKDGRNKTDLLKVIHYAMLLLHFDGHYGEPSMPSGNFEQMP